MISKHLRDIKKLFKAYHKKYTWEGKPVRKLKLTKEQIKLAKKIGIPITRTI